MKFQVKINKKLQAGDIVLVKGFSFFGWLIGTAFRMDSPIKWCSGIRPSSHNGVIGFSKAGEVCVFEAIVQRGFIATPINYYVKKAEAGECEFQIVRLTKGLTPQQFLLANKWLNEQLGTDYDIRSYISHIWRIILRLPPIWNSNNKSHFYCSEAVQKLYAVIGESIFAPITMIAPIHVEQEVAKGTFEVIGECFDA